MKVRTSVKAGALPPGAFMNRSEAFVVKTGVKAGGLFTNRSEAFRTIR